MISARSYSEKMTFAPGATLTNGVSIENAHVVSIFVPGTGYSAASLTFDGTYNDPQISGDANFTDSRATWFPLIDENGVEISCPVVAGRAMILSPIKISGVQRIRLRSGTVASTVTQTAGCDIILGLRSYE